MHVFVVGLGGSSLYSGPNLVHEAMASMSASSKAVLQKSADDWWEGRLAQAKIAISRTIGIDEYLDKLIALEFDCSRELLKDAIRSEIFKTSISRIRLYKLEDGDSLVSTDSAGHAPGDAIRLSLGNITSRRPKNPKKSTEAFLAVDTQQPVILSSDPAFVDVEDEARGADWLEVVRVIDDPCQKVLENGKSKTWMDVPLFVGGKCIGKVSCDLRAKRLSEVDFDTLQSCISVLDRSAQAIEILDTRKRIMVNDLWDRVDDEIDALQSLDSLNEHLAFELPKYASSANGSVFTAHRDSCGFQKLVLRKTSFEDSRALEDGASHEGRRGYYDIGPVDDDSITTAVFNQGRAVRFQNLFDETFLKKQLRSHGFSQVWRNLIPDSDEFRSLLCVPILDHEGMPSGVLRIADKSRQKDSGMFTLEEQSALARICSKTIGRKLHELASLKRGEQVSSNQVFYSAQKLAGLCYRARPNVVFGMAMAEVFSTPPLEGGERAKRLFMLNVVDRRRGSFSNTAIAGCLAEKAKPRLEASYSLRCTITAGALHASDDQAFFASDLQRAESEGRAKRVIEDLRSAMAQKVVLNGGPAVLVVQSDRLDLVPEIHGAVLSKFATYVSRLSQLKE